MCESVTYKHTFGMEKYIGTKNIHDCVIKLIVFLICLYYYTYEGVRLIIHSITYLLYDIIKNVQVTRLNNP